MQTAYHTYSSYQPLFHKNRRINDNLEQQAQALFKSWFVGFEPFKEGKFVDSELGLIPEGWQVEELGNITNSITEKVGKRTDIKVLSPVYTGELLLSEEYFTKQVYSKNLAKYIMVAPNDFAYNPARINIGSIGMNTFDFSGCVSPVYIVFRCEKEYHHFFNIFKATKNFKEEVNTRAIGGVRQTLSYKDFSLIKIVYPPKEVVEQFNKIYSHIMTLIKKNVLENKRLHQTRDTLLPKLMSGELKINDINN
ncbi:restriction endonuclease subunit S [Hoylesella timonensis]|uniref:Restriction endonuclease subunit S n=1 Tax=Hoylesella timonensis TaxID=386414 RepID=A0A2K0XQ14_9BACT|nr:restriction endonuclease subunit S [Hoylesella timonensis]PNP96619.1 restriction endonuclease subunit S [Hoylesella timonensis]